MRTERTITIDAAPERVFALIADPEEHLVWRPLVVEFRPLDGNAFEPGGTAVETATFFGNRYTTIYEVDFEAPQSFSLRSAQGPVAVELGWSLEERDAGTELTLTLDAEPPSRFPFFATAMRWYVDDATNRLKALIEEDRAPVPRWFNFFAAFSIALFALLLTLSVAYTAIHEDPVFAVASAVAAISLWIVAVMLARGRPLGPLR
ncbi:MAG: SRPBCC family protein [Gaiellaceae bacterium]